MNELKKRKIKLENELHRLEIEKILAKSIREEQEIEGKIECIQFELSYIAFEEV